MSALGQPARAADFNRRFDVEAAAANPPAWFSDLLSLWRPSGVPASGDGPRLAIRNGYLNFYRKGQSVARVSFDRSHRLCATVHSKYVFPDTVVAAGQEYLRLSDREVRSGSTVVGSCEGKAMLMTWLRRAEEHAGPEKRAIDAVLDLSSSVIDLEMGQPGTGLRMDMVSIERADVGLQVVFWEAKHARDGRVRCSGPLDWETCAPRVLKQLRDYRAFVSAPGNGQRISEAYRRAAAALIKLRSRADQVGARYPLGQTIEEAASGMLAVSSDARLLIFHHDPTDSGWDRRHASKLRDGGVQMFVQASPACVSQMV